MNVKTFFMPGDRYQYDFDACSADRGWAQLDTVQDAPWYGNWISPGSKMLLEFCEGDVTLTTCETDAEFSSEVRRVIDRHTAQGTKTPLIDGMCNEGTIARFIDLGLGDLLH